MGAKQSEAMLKAKRAVESGQTAYAAAKANGLSPEAIYMSSWWKGRKSRVCQARRHNDQMICSACGLVWDLDDTEPPACGK